MQWISKGATQPHSMKKQRMPKTGWTLVGRILSIWLVLVLAGGTLLAQTNPNDLQNAPDRAGSPSGTPVVPVAEEEVLTAEDLDLLQEEPAAGPAAHMELIEESDATAHPPELLGGPDFFPSSPLLDHLRDFWIMVFAEMSTASGVIHDSRHTYPIYEEVSLEGMSYRRQRSFIAQRKRELRQNIEKLALAVQNNQELTEEQHTLLALFPAEVTPAQLRQYAQEIRFQQGLSERFQQGLIRSGAYLDEIRQILVEHGVPPDLAFLPHVESSYNYQAYSKFGAAGIWQFTQSTGQRYMQIEYEFDERLDPIIASNAAARFLAQITGAWAVGP